MTRRLRSCSPRRDNDGVYCDGGGCPGRYCFGAALAFGGYCWGLASAHYPAGDFVVAGSRGVVVARSRGVPKRCGFGYLGDSYFGYRGYCPCHDCWGCYSLVGVAGFAAYYSAGSADGYSAACYCGLDARLVCWGYDYRISGFSRGFCRDFLVFSRAASRCQRRGAALLLAW